MNTTQPPRYQPTYDELVTAVADALELQPQAITSPTHQHDVCSAREVIVAVLRRFNWRWHRIAAAMHTTTNTIRRRHTASESLIATEPRYAHLYHQLTADV